MSTLVPIQDLKVVSIGEVLWDQFGDERHLGGAPFNFCYQCRAFGAEAAMISRVGDDEAGKEIISRVREARMGYGLDAEDNERRIRNFALPGESLLQVDKEHPTGVVEVSLDTSGKPSYDIIEDVAWDFIDLTGDAIEAIQNAAIVCFGTLAQRNAISRSSIQGALAAAPANCLRVYDINLRQSYYSDEIIRESLALTDLLKMNDEELALLQEIFGLAKDEDSAVQELMSRFDVATVVVTRGANGASAWTPAESVSTPGVEVKVADTVGSGDAFTAVMASQVAAGAPLQDALEMANLAGAYVASQRGATPRLDPQILMGFQNRH